MNSCVVALAVDSLLIVYSDCCIKMLKMPLECLVMSAPMHLTLAVIALEGLLVSVVRMPETFCSQLNHISKSTTAVRGKMLCSLSSKGSIVNASLCKDTATPESRGTQDIS